MTAFHASTIALVMLAAALNPVVIAVAFFLGRAANQWQKIAAAGLAAALAHAVLLGLLLGFSKLAAAAGLSLLAGGLWDLARLMSLGATSAPATSLFAFVAGLAWGALGYATRPRTHP